MAVTLCTDRRLPGMTSKTIGALALATTAVGPGLTTAVPVSVGGVGDFLSPAFGTSCSNLNTGAHNTARTTTATGTAGGGLLGLPLGSPLNQCGGADLPLQNRSYRAMRTYNEGNPTLVESALLEE
ncbi:hypothetical protein ADL06_19510 [Streptomyces sp. NRRL F-6491]|nr:hypothetical protein ADL06_19510 [Streptomyces sp. NRRL F-6491]KOX37787.1 hypothetical protein ADL08_28720 [Streptomyces sp. NRRL F-6492]